MRGGDPLAHVDQLVADDLVLDQRLAEGVAELGVRERLLVGDFGEADSGGCKAECCRR